MPDWVYLLLTLFVIPVIVAAITSRITVWLSLSQFRSQKWWEAKAAAYSTIIEALYNAKHYTDALIDETEIARALTSDERKKLASAASKGTEEIRKATGIGAYIISKEAAACLANLEKSRKADYSNPDYFQVLQNDSGYLAECLSEMRKLAKDELGMK